MIKPQTQDQHPILINGSYWTIDTKGHSPEVRLVIVQRWHEIANEDMVAVICTDNKAYVPGQLFSDKSEAYSALLTIIVQQAPQILAAAKSKYDMLTRRSKIIDDLFATQKAYQDIV